MSTPQQYEASSSRTPNKTSTSSSHQQPREMKLPIKPLPRPLIRPRPWLWRCHSCYTIYRLAVTRRCLNCDHMFCLLAPPKGKKRKRGGPCKAEFDYQNWKDRGSWRRTVLLNGDNAVGGTNTNVAARNNETNWGDEYRAAIEARGGEEQARFEEQRERLFLRRRHDCSLHCDFPSECHHSLYRAQREGRPILRAAEAVDAAEEAARVLAEVEREKAKEGGKQWARRLTVAEYKQRRAERQARKLVAAAEADRVGFGWSMLTADEEEDDDVSPCSPTFDESGDLMCEVSPVENNDGDEPVSPSESSPGRASLLVTTDTPVDFAATAAPLSFDDDTYSDDDDECYGESGTHEDERRRTKSPRKIARLTGEDPESFGPFILSGPSPTSPSAARPGSPSSPTRSSTGVFNMPTSQPTQEHHHAQHADATAVAGEEWESWSESSSTYSSSTSSEVSLLSSSSIDGARDADGAVVDDTDADGDVTMHDDEDTDSPVTPRGERRADRTDDETGDLRALLRMRNSFMRGEMM